MEQIPQIKDVITARSYALYIASKYKDLDLLSTSTSIYNWLTAGIVLPSIKDDYTDKLVEMVNNTNKINEEFTNKLRSI